MLCYQAFNALAACQRCLRLCAAIKTNAEYTLYFMVSENGDLIIALSRPKPRPRLSCPSSLALSSSKALTVSSVLITAKG